MNHIETTNTSPYSKDFWSGVLAGAASNFVALGWAIIWLIMGVLGAGMSSQPAGELDQTLQSFIFLASCCPVVVNLILLVVGIARRKAPFLGGCLVGLLANLLLAGCLVGLWAIRVATTL